MTLISLLKRYTTKSTRETLKTNKINLQFFLRYTVRKKKTWLSRKFLYRLMLYNFDKTFWPGIIYQIYHFYSKYFKRKFLNFKYFFLLEQMYNENIILFETSSTYLRRNKYYYRKIILEYIWVYVKLISKIKFDVFYFMKKTRKDIKRPQYLLILTFRSGKIFINLLDKLKRDYIFLSTGLFIKYFENKKLYKKSKIIRTILAKYLRKIFLLVKIPEVLLIVKKNPVFLIEFLNLFNQPIPYKFAEPITGREIDDNNIEKTITKFRYFIFLHVSAYTKNKTKKKGRIKRKISRKIILRNVVID